MDYEQAGYKASKLVKLDMLVNSEPVDAFSCIVHRDKAESRGRVLAAKLKEVIPQQLYQVGQIEVAFTRFLLPIIPQPK